MRAGDVIVAVKRFANSHRNRLFADVQVCETRHEGTRIQIVDLLLEQANGHHLPVHVKQLFGTDLRSSAGWRGRIFHFAIPDIRARTSNITAKSLSAKPIPLAAVSHSFVVAVVGRGTSSLRPISSASSISFCIMFTLNHASSGILS